MFVARRLAIKLIVIVAIPTAALVYFGGSLTLESLENARSSRQIATLTDTSIAIGNFIHETQKERGRTAGFLGSKGAESGSRLRAQRRLTDERLAELRENYDALGNAGIAPEVLEQIGRNIAAFDALRSHRDAVDAQSLSLPDALGYYTSRNADFIDSIADVSKATISPERGRDLLAYSSLLKSKERSGLERAVLLNVFAQDGFGPGQLAQWLVLKAEQRAYMSDFELLAPDPMLAAFGEASSHRSFGEVDRFRERAIERASRGGFGIEADEWFGTITEKIDRLKSVEDYAAAYIAERAQASYRSETRTPYILGSVVLIALVTSTGLVLYFANSLGTPIFKLLEHIEQLARGDFSSKLYLYRKDEFGNLAGALNQMTDQVGGMISDVAGAAHEVAGAATQIAATSEQMSAGLSNQEQQTNESSAAVEQLSSSIASVADKSSTAAEAAANAGREAEDGGSVVSETIGEIRGIAEQVRVSVRTVDALGVKSEAIGEIIAVINDIADQTNLLALNAAIEAARAGEHGRGFAVVADEVRKLAERTTTATEQVSSSIREIQDDTKAAIEQIEQGSNRVENGVQMASNAGGSLERIVDASKTLRTMVDDIAHAIDEQQVGAQQIAEATSGIAQVTQESASAASEAKAAASNLSQQAERLLSLTSGFSI